jgi:hypothetical protein
MRYSKMFLSCSVLLLLFVWAAPASAADQEKEFQAINKMSFKELAERSKSVLEKKYPGEQWDKYKFPKYVYINDAVLASYKIAVKEPELLSKFPCYCFCEAMGHKNLAYCFLKHGVPGQFEEHASGCNTCDAEAMHVFLWKELGVSPARMLQALKEIYGH